MKSIEKRFDRLELHLIRDVLISGYGNVDSTDNKGDPIGEKIELNNWFSFQFNYR